MNTHDSDITALINEAENIITIAQDMKNDSSENTTTNAGKLRTRYTPWRALALTVLTGEHRDRFLKEYHGSMMTPKIKHVLERENQENTLAMEIVNKRFMSDVWRGATLTTFIDALGEQINILWELLSVEALRTVLYEGRDSTVVYCPDGGTHEDESQ